jgi:hypothetical protein
LQLRSDSAYVPYNALSVELPCNSEAIAPTSHIMR